MLRSFFDRICNNAPPKRLDTAVDAVAAATGNGCFAWLHYNGPTRKELSGLVELLGLHSLSIEDCLDDNQIPKIEDFLDNAFVLLNISEHDRCVLDVCEMNPFIGDKLLVSVSHLYSLQRLYLDETQYIVEENIEGARQGPSRVFNTVLEYIVDHASIAIEAEVDDVEGALFSGPVSFRPAELIRHRRCLLGCARSCFMSA